MKPKIKIKIREKKIRKKQSWEDIRLNALISFNFLVFFLFIITLFNNPLLEDLNC